MSNKKADIEADIDAHEDVSLMEPMLISSGSKHYEKLVDLSFDLVACSTGLRKSLPAPIVRALSGLVRSMNCYYSNLIEGHNTHPIDIERALNEDFFQDEKRRDLQLEAKAHIAVQSWIDERGLAGRATSTQGILEIHRRFCELLPEDLLLSEDRATGEKIRLMPGEFRHYHVQVGRHVPVSPGAVPRFMTRLEGAFRMCGKVDKIIAAATAHHRLLWIHPFMDGNGRVARLMSYAMVDDSLDTGGIWSIARGLARHEKSYKAHLAACDLGRRNDLDGRGNLSEETLAAFAVFFLETCIDQVKFMEGLVEPDRLRQRILLWAEEEMGVGGLPPKSGQVLEAILNRGQLPRKDVGALLGITDRHARRITSPLLKQGILVSETIRTPLQLAFPATLASRWMPGLFPER